MLRRGVSLVTHVRCLSACFATTTLPPRTKGGHVLAAADDLAAKCFPNELEDWNASGSSFLSLVGNRAVFDPAFVAQHRERLQKIVQDDLLGGNQDPSGSFVDTVYNGNPGIAYALLQLAQFFPDSEPEHRACLAKADEVLARPLVGASQPMWARTRISLQCGETGLCVVRALSAHGKGNSEAAAAIVKSMLTFPHADIPPIEGVWNRLKWWVSGKMMASKGMSMNDIYDSNEWLYGRAGYIHACILLRHTFAGDEQPYAAVSQELRAIQDEVVHATLREGRTYAQSHGKCSPLMYRWAGGEYLGAAHGIMGILHMLLDADTVLDDPELMEEVRASVDFVASKEQFLDHDETIGGHFGSLDDDQPATLVQFCHGAPGAVWLFSKAFEVYGDEQYKQLALRSGEAVWCHGLLRKGPGVCHGMSGSGYAMLRLFRLERDPKWLHRACAMSEYMLSEEVVAKSRKPDNPLSLFEGAAGTALFLADVLRPSMATMPLFELPEYEDVGSATTMEEAEGCSIAVVVK
jgi:hypothetical protein